MKIEKLIVDNTPVYSTFIDSSTSCGILRFSHELSLCVTVDENGECHIRDGWEMNCGGDWSWEPGEEKEFESSHPGLLNKVAKEIAIYESNNK